MTAAKPPTISVITATLNAGRFISLLSADLQAQTDANFDWIVVDGGSSDNTLTQFSEKLKDRITVIQERDFGIYDALNKGLRHCRSDYYLVIGADDRLSFNAIEVYRRLAAESGADIVAASVKDGDRIATPGRGKPWLRGHNAYLSHHSAGTLIRRSLHEKFGFYSHAFPITADQLFVKRAVMGGARVRCAPDFVAGEFARCGVSSVHYTATLFEFTLVQFQTEKYKLLQLLIFVVRLFRHWRKITR